MITLFILIVLVTVWNVGIEVVLSDGMALERVRKWAQENKSEIWQPLVWCIWCRPSIHGIFVVIAAWLSGIICFTWNIVILYPFVVSGSSFLSGFIWSIYKLIEVKTKYYIHKEQDAFFDLKDRKVKHIILKTKTKNYGTLHT